DDAVLRGQQTFRVAWHDVDAHPAVPDPVVHELDVVPAVRIDTRPGLDVLDVVPGHQDVLTAGSLGVVQVAARDTVGVHQRRGHEQAAHGVVQDLTTLARDLHDARVLTIGQGVLGDVEVLHPLRPDERPEVVAHGAVRDPDVAEAVGRCPLYEHEVVRRDRRSPGRVTRARD